ncbi:MAG TPA: Druantia anti-phage system protein DruA [Candidatus Paceibacterota bacterium]|nr:Druantia anti-phage system protein DruA [Candidatus Paceibacterota bacterium]
MALTATRLKRDVLSILRKQGYSTRLGTFTLKQDDREAKKDAHRFAKAERLVRHRDFVERNAPLIKEHFINGRKLEVEKIKPRLIEVQTGTKWETIFRWWNLTWWSLPYEQSYGRQMRFVVWDEYHKSPIGLIGLQSPILSWSVRDEHLGIPAEERDFWVNQSLSAQRLGALPPYNYILGGKLVASLMTSEVVRKKFADKYRGKKTLLKNRELPARLLFLTTTGAYGKSPVYSRLKFNEQEVARFIGYTRGTGSFHIPNALYEDLVAFLEQKGYEVGRGFGNGPSRKMRLILQALDLLGFPNGTSHGIERAVYLFPLASNVKDVIQKNARPKWHRRSVDELAEFWKEKWAKPRAEKDSTYRTIDTTRLVENAISDLERCEELAKNI